MKQHQKSVLGERAKLKEKLDALKSFIAESAVFPTLPPVEQEQLHSQASVMQTYDDILCRRIAGFDERCREVRPGQEYAFALKMEAALRTHMTNYGGAEYAESAISAIREEVGLSLPNAKSAGTDASEKTP
jgi:hypothetical protein